MRKSSKTTTEQKTTEQKVPNPQPQPQHDTTADKKDWAAIAKGQASQPKHAQPATDTAPTTEATDQAAAADQPAQTDALAATIDSLHAKIQALETQLTTQHDQLLRAQAKVANAHLHAQKDVSNARKFALTEFAKALLAVIDSLEHSLNNSTDNDDPVVQKIHQGNELTLQMFLSTIRKFGVEQVNPLGERFNPDFHEAISTQKDPKAKAHTILQVLQKGYLLNGRLVRPAMVIVAKG